jgi:uncharacterized protein (DUF433 family)
MGQSTCLTVILLTAAEILEEFSELTLEDIKACLAFAADREKKLFVASL